jgi:hypothetical protein
VIGVRRAAWIGLAIGLASFVSCGPSVSDTGLVGTWRRTFGEHGRSEVAFWKAADGTYRFRANRFNHDGMHELRCGAEGPCLEYGTEPEPYYEYHYRVFERPGESGLFVECDGRPHGTSPATPLQQIERFDVEPGGLVLKVWLVEQNHRTARATMPRTQFDKVSDDPFE